MTRQYRAPPVDEQPRATLRRWRVYEVLNPAGRHLAGYCVETGRWRTTTPIRELRGEGPTVVTASGRFYQLEGAPDIRAGLARHIWMMRVHQEGVHVWRDVTDEILVRIRH